MSTKGQKRDNYPFTDWTIRHDGVLESVSENETVHAGNNRLALRIWGLLNPGAHREAICKARLNGEKISDIAERCGISYHACASILASAGIKKNRAFTRADRAELLKTYVRSFVDEGKSIDTIAGENHVSPQTVRAALLKAGWTVSKEHLHDARPVPPRVQKEAATNAVQGTVEDVQEEAA